MSSNPIPVEAERAPFVPTTTPTIERANRLMGLRSHPGYLDLVRLINELVQESIDATSEYPGWDPNVIVILKVKQQAASEFPKALTIKINNAIDAGLSEAKAQVETASAPPMTAADAVDQGDYVRQRVLQTFEEMDNRVPGSY